MEDSLLSERKLGVYTHSVADDLRGFESGILPSSSIYPVKVLE